MLFYDVICFIYVLYALYTIYICFYNHIEGKTYEHRNRTDNELDILGPRVRFPYLWSRFQGEKKHVESEIWLHVSYY